jgi:hypothetical protein
LLKQMGPERNIGDLVAKYAELRHVAIQPLRAPMLAPYLEALVKRCSQFYIDTTFDLLVAKLYLTPLLAALPPLDASAARNTAGPVVPIAFYMHQARAPVDYKYFLGVLKELGVQPAVMHRDFDDALGKAISEVRSPLVMLG